MNKNIYIFGAGPSGAVIGRRYAEEGHQVTIFEIRDHVAGNLYDYIDENGIIIHKYGPHIFQCSNNKIIDYVKQFGEWKEFRHKVNVKIGDKEVPLPINFESIDILFPSKAEELKSKLKKEFNSDTTFVMDLLNSSNSDLKELGEFVYKNVFENYTSKMWGIDATEIDQSVLKRVPIRLSYDDGYFSDTFQAVPTKGYTKLFESILDHPNIELKLNQPKNLLTLKDNKTYIDGKEVTDTIIWTGPVDQLFDYKHGDLPYRSLRFEFESLDVGSFQSRSVVNYPADLKITRITEYKKLSQQEDQSNLKDITTIGREYPGEYKRGSKQYPDPYYPVIKKDNINPADVYFKEAESITNIKLLGRLAEYKYKQMWQAIADALEMEL